MTVQQQTLELMIEMCLAVGISSEKITKLLNQGEHLNYDWNKNSSNSKISNREN